MRVLSDLLLQCNHLGRPQLFNPFEQVSLTQATLFLAIVDLHLHIVNDHHYYCQIWSSLLVSIK